VTKLDDEHFRLDATGRVIYANLGLLSVGGRGDRGIGMGKGEMGLYSGYDDYEDSKSAFTVEERRELADYAIALWQEFAAP
jgi:hypothetical protein